MENMTPAIQNTDEKTLKQLSPEEFQQTLSSWFHEKGLVQDMKSYLKFQMVKVLKNTSVGTDIKRSASLTSTLTQQASHLIVAEYLLYHHCHFALSLFSTEVNLSNVLPETKPLLDAESVPNKFDKENLISILELIGISKQQQCFNKILHEYLETRGNSLLGCLLGFVGKDTVKFSNEEEYQTDTEFELDDFMKNVYLTLQSSNLSAKMRTQLLHNLKVCYDLKTNSYEAQVSQLIDRFKKELNYYEQKLEHNQRRRRCLEKKLVKLKEENQVLQSKLDQDMCQKIVSNQCPLNHCNDSCEGSKRLCESYKKEIDKLKSLNLKQNEEIERLNRNFNELMQEFNSCQTKISLVNTRLREEVVDEPHHEDSEIVSLSSGSLTEEIVQQARQKLRLLEEESDQLDIRFSNFVIK